MIKIPDTWHQVLLDIQKVCPSAVIAGGALRDLYHEKPVKDIDIFIEAGTESEASALLQKMGGKVPDDGFAAALSDIDQTGAYPESMKEVMLVVDYPGKHNCGKPVQLIFVNWRSSAIMERFDIGLCKLYYDGKSLEAHSDFHEDSRDKILNIRRCENKWMLGASIKRYARLMQKYPDFDLALEGVELDETGLNSRRCTGP